MKVRSKLEMSELLETKLSKKQKSDKPKNVIESRYPVLKLKHNVLFPHQDLPYVPECDVKYLKKLLDLSKEQNRSKKVCVVFELDPQQTGKKFKNLPMLRQLDIFDYAVLASIETRVQLGEGAHGYILKGIQVVKLEAVWFLEETHTYGECEIDTSTLLSAKNLDDEMGVNKKDEIKLKFLKKYLKANEFIASEEKEKLYLCADLVELCDHVMSLLVLQTSHQLEYLTIREKEKKFQFLKECIEQDKRYEKLNRSLNNDVRTEIEDLQKRFYIKEQIKALKRELGEIEGNSDITIDFRKRLKLLNVPPKTHRVLEEEIKRLDSTPEGSPEFAVHHQYLHFIFSLPWNRPSVSDYPLNSAVRVLDNHHYGLNKVKGRILEYLAAKEHSQTPQGTILAFLGPPGVGKTSLAQSIAKALGRNFVKISLAGVRDEAEIRGHRRTYLGAMPGRILQGIKQAGSNQCVILLDEIDKAGTSENMSVQSSLLELLDPEQNSRFSDHYVNIEYDLSQVIFIATANDFSRIHDALKDRFEILELSSYTESEKVKIMKSKTLRKICKELRLSAEEFRFKEEQIRRIIRGYTREAGIRELKRIFESIARKIILHKVQKTDLKFDINSENFLVEYLGPPKFISDDFSEQSLPGFSFGLAYTDVGGELLPIEVSLRESKDAKSSIQLTGSLGSVMKESMLAACTAVSAWTKERDPDKFFQPEQMHIHVHAPDGGTPKDGPSAGLAISMALCSAIHHHPIPKDIAFTGEISIRGQVLAVGGIKEKIIAADRYHKKRVFIPQQNIHDLQDVPKEVLDRVEIKPVKNMREVLDYLVF